MRHVFVLAAIVLSFIGLGCGSSDSPGADGGSRELAASATLDPNQVPESFRHLVPLARQWGVGDDDERGALTSRASAVEREALTNAMVPHQADITAWLDSFAPDEMSDEAAAFMYLQLALEEMP
jgi:hypothetical protein